jgi:hypothetical protein
VHTPEIFDIFIGKFKPGGLPNSEAAGFSRKNLVGKLGRTYIIEPFKLFDYAMAGKKTER